MEVKLIDRRIIPLILLALLGMGLVWWITRAGPGMSGDSVRYIMGGENLLSGKGYSRVSGADEIRPITGFPPFYSIILAMIGVAGFDLVAIARGLNILLLGFNIFMVWITVFTAVRSMTISYLAAIMFAVNLSVLKYHSWLLTEPLYISLSLICIFLLLRFTQNMRLLMLVLAAVAVGLATITRLIGLSLILAGSAFLLVSSFTGLKRRVTYSSLFFAISITPLILWLVRNSIAGETALNRTVLYHAMSIELIKGYLLFFGDWIQLHRLFPGQFRSIIAIVVAIAGPVAYLVFRVRSSLSQKIRLIKEEDHLIWLLFLYGLVYVLVLFVNSTFLDASTTPYAPERYLVAIYPLFVMLMLVTYSRVLAHIKPRQVTQILLLTIISLIISLQVQASFQVLRRHEMPLGYTTFIAENPELVRAVHSIAGSHVLYSNNPELTYAISGHGAYILPYQYNTYTDSENPDFDQDVEVMEADLSAGALVLHFGEKDDYQVELYRLLDLQLIESYPGGELLKWK